MRDDFKVFDPLNRDTSWITQEVIEEYAGALCVSQDVADITLGKLAGGRRDRYDQFMQCVAVMPEIRKLQNELIEEYGEEYFLGPPMSKEKFIRHLENRLLAEKDNEVAAKLSKELREARGWVTKPSEQSTQVDIVNLNGSVKFDRSKPAEAEKLYMAIAGAALAR